MMSNEIDRYGKWTKEGLHKKIKELKSTLNNINKLSGKWKMPNLLVLDMHDDLIEIARLSK